MHSGVQKADAHLVIGYTHRRNGVRITPHVVLDKLDSFLLEILTAIAKHFPFLFPSAGSVCEGTCKLVKLPLVGLYRLFRLFESKLNLFEIFTLDKRRLGSVRVYANAVILIFLARFFHVSFLRLLGLERLFNRGLGLFLRSEAMTKKRSTRILTHHFLEMCLFGQQLRYRLFKFFTHLLRKTRMCDCLPIGL